MVVIRNLFKVFFVSLCTNSAYPEIFTAGTFYDVSFVSGDAELPSLEYLVVLNECEAQSSCIHVVKLKKTGELKKITSVKELEELKNKGDVALVWTKMPRKLKNVAFKGNTKAISNSGVNSLAVDGSKDNQYQSCFHSASADISHWWRVAFGAPVLVYSVTITNAGGGLYPQLAAFFKEVDIRVGYQDTNGVNPYCRRNISIATLATVDFRCDNEVPGTFLFIEKQITQLYLCEVEVFGIFLF
ncbi:fucolectin-4-like [Rhopilema esculentum]|uniref:fucolectin-4-like n=1 Tax=Rhopilema esculentum TaxID=499914 RepID=UPI0031D5253D